MNQHSKANLIIDSLDAPIEPVQRPKSYNSSLRSAAFVMVVLAMVYSLLLAGLFWFCLNLFFSVLSFRSGLFGTIFYAALFLGFFSLFLSLAKPLFLAPDSERGELELQRDREPQLFAFVDRVCQLVGAPAPNRIHVDLAVNAGAGFETGVFDKQMKLLIGLPLVVGLNTRQLAGIIAHEFGHFSQATGMRLTYLVRSIDQWFITASEGQDIWDGKIEELAATSQFPPARWFFRFVFWIVIAGRKVLSLLVMFGHFFVASLLREMEFDADRHEARLCGSMNFAGTSRKMRLLELSQHKSFSDLAHYHRTNRLPDNLPAIMVDNAENIDEEKFRELEEELLKMETNWFDSHPSDRERIENAARENSQGVYQVERPAMELFSDINGLCRLCTKRMYHDIFGREFKPEKLKSSDELIASAAVSRKESKAALRFALEQFSSYDTFYLPRYHLGEATDSNTYHATTDQRRQQLLSWVTNHTRIQVQEDQLLDEMVDVTCARRLMEAGFNLSQAGTVFPVTNLPQAQQKSIEHRQREMDIKSRLTTFRQVMGQRLIDALEFLRSDQIVQSIEEPANVVDEVKLILQIWQRIVGLRSAFDTFFFEVRVTSLLLMAASHHFDEQAWNSINQSVGRVHSSMAQFQSQTGDLRYPFEHGTTNVSVAHYLLPKLPPASEISEVLDVASDMDDNLEYLLKRCVARLGALAEKIERVFGFEPLEPPQEVLQIQKAAEDEARRKAQE